MRHTTVVQLLAQLIDARLRCYVTNNTEWYANHTTRIESLAKDVLPSGSGIDSGTKIDLDRSTADKIVLTTAFHHMNDGGYYSGWTEHTVTIRPSLAFGFNLTIGGRDRNQIKDYLSETFHYVLCQAVEETADDQGWSTFRLVTE